MGSVDTGKGRYGSPVDCTTPRPDFDLSGKTAVVTGGSNGIGAQYVRRLVQAGANVTIGDLDEAGAKCLIDELGDKVTFSRCNVIEWSEQVTLFTTALEHTGSIDIVIANAGIVRPDDIHADEPDADIPTKPTLPILETNLIGVLYTTKLALHYFRRQHREQPNTDTVLILQGSLAGYFDLPGCAQYMGAKWGLRGLYRTLRLNSRDYGTRLNYIAPWFVDTAILGDEMSAFLKTTQAGFAEVEDVAEGMMRLVGGEVHGRAIAILPRSKAPKSGIVDLDSDEPAVGSDFSQWQADLDAALLIPPTDAADEAAKIKEAWAL